MQPTSLKQTLHTFVLASICAFSSMAALPVRAQSDASVGLSMVPIASVVATGASAGATAGAVSTVPVVLAVAGSTLVVKAIEISAHGTVYLLERASDEARVSVAVASDAAEGAAIAVGTTVLVSVIASGAVLSAAGEVLAYIPNAAGRALLHDERLK